MIAILLFFCDVVQVVSKLDVVFVVHVEPAAAQAKGAKQIHAILELEVEEFSLGLNLGDRLRELGFELVEVFKVAVLLVAPVDDVDFSDDSVLQFVSEEIGVVENFYDFGHLPCILRLFK